MHLQLIKFKASAFRNHAKLAVNCLGKLRPLRQSFVGDMYVQPNKEEVLQSQVRKTAAHMFLNIVQQCSV